MAALPRIYLKRCYIIHPVGGGYNLAFNSLISSALILFAHYTIFACFKLSNTSHAIWRRDTYTGFWLKTAI